MTLLVLIILAVVWAAVLLPPYLQNRSEGRPGDSISSFQKQLSVLERRSYNSAPGAAPRAVGYRPSASVLRMSRMEAKRRRRDILFTLAAASGITLVMAALLGGRMWYLQLICDFLLAGYVYLLFQANQAAMERSTKVRYLPQRQARPSADALLLRRSGS